MASFFLRFFVLPFVLCLGVVFALWMWVTPPPVNVPVTFWP